MASLVPGEVLRVLLISTESGLRDRVEHALSDRAGDHKLYYVSQADLALGRATDLIPHVILVDDALEGSNLPTLIGLLVQRSPRAAIIALIAEGALMKASGAVLAGARAFLIKPLREDELFATLRQVLEGQKAQAPQEPVPMVNGKIIVFCAPKGGTGRTTLAINTAIAIHQERHDGVVLVDGDFTVPAIDVALNLDTSRNIIDLLPHLARLDADLVSSVLTSHASGVKVLLAPPPADLMHPITLPQAQQVLAWLKRMFPWVLVDLGLPLDDTAFAFLDGADRIVMTVLPEMVGLRNTRLMLDQLRERGYSDEKTWIVLNRADLRGGVSQADIESRLKVHIRYRVPDDQALATHTVNRGVPLMMGHENSGLARTIRKFASQLSADLAPVMFAEEESLLGRLLGRAAPSGA